MSTNDVATIQDEIKILIAKIIEVEPTQIQSDTNFVEDLGADSMMALEILASVEKKYKIKIPEEYLTKVTSLNSMVEIAKKSCKFQMTNYDAETLCLYPKKFNTIISSNLFFYLQNREKAIKRWTQLLSHKGKILFMEEYPFVKSTGKEMGKHAKELMELIDPVSPEKIEELMIKNGFYLIKKVDTKIDEKHNLYGLLFSLKKTK